jgi:hypothetical protein
VVQSSPVTWVYPFDEIYPVQDLSSSAYKELGLDTAHTPFEYGLVERCRRTVVVGFLILASCVTHPLGGKEHSCKF